MIRFYATSLVSQASTENSASRIQAIKAIRAARTLGGTLGKPAASLRQAKDDIDSAAEFFVTETEDRDAARRISRELETPGLEWRVETGDVPNPAQHLQAVPDEGSEPEEAPAQSERPMPSYEAAQAALILMVLTDGNIGGALSGAQSIGRVLEDDPGKGDPFWNEVTVCLLDSFPVRGPGVNEGVENMAKRLRAGGFQ